MAWRSLLLIQDLASIQRRFCLWYVIPFIKLIVSTTGSKCWHSPESSQVLPNLHQHREQTGSSSIKAFPKTLRFLWFTPRPVRKVQYPPQQATEALPVIDLCSITTSSGPSAWVQSALKAALTLCQTHADHRLLSHLPNMIYSLITFSHYPSFPLHLVLSKSHPTAWIQQAFIYKQKWSSFQHLYKIKLASAAIVLAMYVKQTKISEEHMHPDGVLSHGPLWPPPDMLYWTALSHDDVDGKPHNVSFQTTKALDMRVHTDERHCAERCRTSGPDITRRRRKRSAHCWNISVISPTFPQYLW